MYGKVMHNDISLLLRSGVVSLESNLIQIINLGRFYVEVKKLTFLKKSFCSSSFSFAKTPKTIEPFIKLVRLPLSHVEQFPPGAENTMDIPLNMNKLLELAYQGLKDDIIEILKTSKPDWVFYDYGTVWLVPIAKSLNIASVYSITPVWNIDIQNYNLMNFGEDEFWRERDLIKQMNYGENGFRV
jgi:hypothetical protein